MVYARIGLDMQGHVASLLWRVGGAKSTLVRNVLRAGVWQVGNVKRAISTEKYAATHFVSSALTVMNPPHTLRSTRNFKETELICYSP